MLVFDVTPTGVFKAGCVDEAPGTRAASELKFRAVHRKIFYLRTVYHLPNGCVLSLHLYRVRLNFNGFLDSTHVQVGVNA